jgi:DNA-binding transcriptional MerR regulator/methylmalonyl-CoA mutase cobalamin-binding subunit
MPPSPSQALCHAIKVVCHRTGLSAHVIRVWERRYGLICCKRTDSNRRLYSDEEIERLRLLKLLTDNGHRISTISSLSLEELYTLYKKESAQPVIPLGNTPCAEHKTPEQCLACCLHAVQNLEAPLLAHVLDEARLRYGQRITLLRIIAPLVQEIGERWRKGEFRVAHEHLATSALRDYLAEGARSYPANASSPELVVSTPSGQMHEVGALLASAAARDLGWRVTYLGPSLPPEEIAACAQLRKARAVALSLVYPSDDTSIPAQLAELRRLLPQHIALIIGGRAAYGYFQALNVPDVRLVSSLEDVEEALDEIAQRKITSETVSSSSLTTV